MPRIISVSVLSADFGQLNRDMDMINRSEAEWVHIDVMDGVFVPNISFGFPVLKYITAASPKFMDVHLMIIEPERYVERFAEAGADMITIHYEAVADIEETLDLIKKQGVKCGISIKPATPVEEIAHLVGKVDLVLVMSVEPGFGGQKFMPESVGKVKKLREIIDTNGYSTLIEIDGGVGTGNAGMLFEAGCDALVAGNAIFASPDPEQTIKDMLAAKA